jgi:hypothetical protein
MSRLGGYWEFVTLQTKVKKILYKKCDKGREGSKETCFVDVTCERALISVIKFIKDENLKSKIQI